MERARFQLALEAIPAHEWRLFEQFANQFLASEFPDLRALSHPSGDKGRDAFIWQPTEDETIALQYSVAKDWKSKLRDTAKTVSKNFAATSVLLYLTNQDIAAAADDLRAELRRDYGMYVDVRDISWFLDVADMTPPREAAAEELAARIVDPLLAKRGVKGSQGQALTSVEAQGAFVYLEMQLVDDSRDKGLTKVSYEALVRAVLRDTNSDQRKSRSTIHAEVAALVPGHDEQVVARYVDAALKRLTKNVLRHWMQADEFCMTYEESTRLEKRRTEIEVEDRGLNRELNAVLEATAVSIGLKLPEDREQLTARLRRVLETILLARGEHFVSAIHSESLDPPSDGEVHQKVVADVATYADKQRLKGNLIPLVVGAIERLLRAPGDNVQRHLRALADTYTLYAFLRETPDVQSAVKKMFSHGEIWLDTNVVLSLIAETLVDESVRTFAKILQAAFDAGLSLKLTEGVLEEVEAHMHLCLTYVRHDERTNPWRGRTPFIYASFALTGRPRGEFPNWLENFRGKARPKDDVADYLLEHHGVRVENLEEYADKAPEDLRVALKELWLDAHTKRRRDEDMDPGLVNVLANHDVENYLGVIQRRRDETKSALGYSTWWLTLDRTAYSMRSALGKQIGADAPASPVMSADFLANYLAFGPNRSRVSGAIEQQLPLSADLAPLDLLPAELLSFAEEVREELADLPERIVNRRIRDSLDAARAKLGDLASGGLDVRLEDLKVAIREHAHGS